MEISLNLDTAIQIGGKNKLMDSMEFQGVHVSSVTRVGGELGSSYHKHRFSDVQRARVIRAGAKMCQEGPQ